MIQKIPLSRTAKILLSLLCGPLLASLFPTSARAADVTLYGLLNVDFEFASQKDSSGLSNNRINSWGGSQLGVRGTEPLGGGTNAIFQIESAILPDTGGTGLAGRTTYLGLQGNWGAVKLGRMSLYDGLFPYFADAAFRNDVLTHSLLWAQSGIDHKYGGFDNFLSNALRYDSPVWNGLRGGVQYSTEENDAHGYNLSAALFYDNAGLQLATAYSCNSDYREIGNNDWALTAVAAYNFGFLRLMGLYERLEYEVNMGRDTLARNLYGAGITVPVGKFKIVGFYGYADDGKGNETSCVGDICGGEETGAQQWALTVNYPLSKRTWLYSGYMYLENDARANYTYFREGNRSIAFGPSAVTPGVDQQGVAVGMVHLF